MESLSDIAVFVKVVDSGSFTEAANRLGLSKSVVSKYITRLENHLSAQLLQRTTRQLNLTEVGRVFYEHSRQGLLEIEKAKAIVSQLQEAPRGLLRVNAPMSFGILHIAPLIQGFLDLYPELSIDINYDDRKVDLIEEGFDLAIRIADLSDSSLVARRLGPCRHVLCATPDYLKRNGTPRTPEDLCDHNAIIFKYQDSPTQWQFLLADGKSSNISVTGSIQMNNSLALRKTLINDAGIALIPTFIVGEDIKSGILQTVLTQYKLLENSIFAVYHQRRHLSPKVRAFIDFLSGRITDKPYWD
ncbi:Transcriptional regulator, LysR family [hydrothermal vent metagenome]|uniref:Transcriptional regulator, LysR family n=1 Tax=hydrothermal vent metagenome TaxID=652676 RepID=A0A3B0WUS4_9ZZZZ